jgi:glycosyltransferase involved in cell wall biosynthesis
MRLLVISSYWPRPGRPHNALFEVEQIAAFAELGHHVNVLVQTTPWRPNASYMTPAELELKPDQVQLQQIVVPRLPEPLSRNRAGALVNVWAAGLRLRAFFDSLYRTSEPFDAVIVHGERNIGLSAGLWNVDESRCTAMIVHGADPVLESLSTSFLQKYFGPSASRGLRKVILVGNRLRSYATHVGYDSERIVVIPNGFRHPAAAASRRRGDDVAVRIVAVGRLVAVKGIDDALRALARVQIEHPTLRWQFDILGDGPERAALEKLARELGLSEEVRFYGAVPHAQVMETLGESEIFVLPSWNEAFGLAYLEAMAMGTAVVGCFENGADDIVTDGEDGCLVPPRDVDALAKTLTMLISDPTRREAIARAGMTSVKRFSWSANTVAVLKALDLQP